MCDDCTADDCAAVVKAQPVVNYSGRLICASFLFVSVLLAHFCALRFVSYFMQLWCSRLKGRLAFDYYFFPWYRQMTKDENTHTFSGSLSLSFSLTRAHTVDTGAGMYALSFKCRDFLLLKHDFPTLPHLTWSLHNHIDTHTHSRICVKHQSTERKKTGKVRLVNFAYIFFPQKRKTKQAQRLLFFGGRFWRRFVPPPDSGGGSGPLHFFRCFFSRAVLGRFFYPFRRGEEVPSFSWRKFSPLWEHLWPIFTAHTRTQAAREHTLLVHFVLLFFLLLGTIFHYTVHEQLHRRLGGSIIYNSQRLVNTGTSQKFNNKWNPNTFSKLPTLYRLMMTMARTYNTRFNYTKNDETTINFSTKFVTVQRIIYAQTNNMHRKERICGLSGLTFSHTVIYRWRRRWCRGHRITHVIYAHTHRITNMTNANFRTINYDNFH